MKSGRKRFTDELSPDECSVFRAAGLNGRSAIAGSRCLVG